MPPTVRQAKSHSSAPHHCEASKRWRVRGGWPEPDSAFQPAHHEPRLNTKEADHPRSDERCDKDRKAQHGHPRMTTVVARLAGRCRMPVVLRQRPLNDARALHSRQ